MTQVIACECGKKFSAGPHLAGKSLPCPVCGRTLRIPAGEVSPPIRVPVYCNLCGSRYEATADKIGKQATCKKCGESMVISASPPEQSSSHPVNPFLLDEYSLQPASAARPAPVAPQPSARPPQAKPLVNVGSGVPRFLDMMEENETALGQIGHILLGLSLVFCTMEIVPGWGFIGDAFNLQWPPAVFYVIAGVAGAVGGFLIGGRYCVPGMIGFAIGAVCSVFAASLPLHRVQSIHTGILMLLAVLGLLPGMGVFQILKSVQDTLLGAPPSAQSLAEQQGEPTERRFFGFKR